MIDVRTADIPPLQSRGISCVQNVPSEQAQPSSMPMSAQADLARRGAGELITLGGHAGESPMLAEAPGGGSVRRRRRHL
jgi:hypothetical protein